jgi:hypothetical protein
VGAPTASPAGRGAAPRNLGHLARALALGAAALAVGCPAGDHGPQHPAHHTVRVRAFTEAASVRRVAVAGPYLFAAAAHGLDRWDASGTTLRLDLGHGARGDRALAMATDTSRGWLWVVTESTVGYYDVAHQTFTEVPPPPGLIGLELPTVGAIAPATDGGVWLGNGKGLFYTNAAGQWTATKINDPIRALYSADDGWLWIASNHGVIGKKPNGESFQFGPTQGCQVVSARVVGRGPGGGVMVIGEDPAGKQEVSLWTDGAWSSFRVSPDARWEAITPHGDAVIVLGGRHLYRVAPRNASERRPLTRDGYRLLPTAGKGPDLVVDNLDVPLPAGEPSVAVWGDDLVVGTNDVGIARVTRGGQGPITWLRRSEMLAGATTLSVACRERDNCWVATGARRAWRWRGDDFEADGPVDQAVLAVVRAPSGEIYALHRPGDAKKLSLSKVEPSGWTPVAEIETPGDRPTVTFARFAPGGLLWVGLRYHAGVEERPWGVAVVDVSVGAAAYYHASGDRRDVKRGILPVPISTADAAFMDENEVWFATSEGAARLVGKKVTVWNEATGMASELVHAIAASPGGVVFAGTGAGVGEFDGDKWTFPRALRFAVNDLALARDGRLWLATDRGIGLYDGRRVRRLDVRRGLLENEIQDIALDAFGRVWARGPKSLTVIVP